LNKKGVPLDGGTETDSAETSSSIKTHDLTFSTEPKHYVKRGCSTVRTRCIDFVDQLKTRGYTLEIPLEQAKAMFSEIVGAYDRATVKAYFGTLPGRSTRLIRRVARYQSGTFSFKNIELTQDAAKSLGYLEKLGLVTYERHGKVWFMVLENLVVVSQLVKSDHMVTPSIDKISLTPFSQGERLQENRFEKVVLPSGSLESTQTNNNLQGEREIGRVKVIADTDLYTEIKNLVKTGPIRNDDKLERALGHKSLGAEK